MFAEPLFLNDDRVGGNCSIFDIADCDQTSAVTPAMVAIGVFYLPRTGSATLALHVYLGPWPPALCVPRPDGLDDFSEKLIDLLRSAADEVPGIHDGRDIDLGERRIRR